MKEEMPKPQFDEQSKKIGNPEGQQASYFDNSPKADELTRGRGGALTQEESRQSAILEEERKKHGIFCKRCNQKRVASEISIVSSRGNFCRDCASTIDAK